MFILVAWLHCFVYISNDVVTRGYIHLVFIIFRLREHGTTGGTTLACSPLFVGFGDAVMFTSFVTIVLQSIRDENKRPLLVNQRNVDHFD